MPIWSPKPSWASLTNGLLVLCGVLTAAQASVHTYAEHVSPMLGVPRSSSGTGTGTRAGDDLLSCISEMAPETTPVSPNLFDDSRIGTNFRYDSFHPILILNVSTVSVIQAAVVCAGKQGVTVIPMNGGHSFEGMSCTDGLLLHLDEFNDVVAVDESESGVLMTVEAGIRLARMYGLVIQYSDAQAAAGSESSYAVAGGTCPTVGVTGHTLCGGYGMLGRHVGLTSDQLVSIQLVTAGGDVVTATADNEHRDLFWAAKGGCSSAFGIVVSLTFRLLKLKSSAITTMDMLIPYNIPDVEGIAVWWQVWASREAIDTATSTIHLQSDGLRLQTVYIGSKADSEFANLVAEMAVGLKNFATADDIWASSIEGNFLDAVLWWSGDNDLNSVDDLLAVKSLDPLDTRSHSRRKSKSLLALGRPIPREGIKSIIDYEISGELNAVEWKVYGGVNPVTDTFYTDDRSPLLRGHLLEMHYGNSYGGEGSPEEDAQLVQDVDAIGETLSKYFAGTAGYIGYIDYELEHPGTSYFGADNAAKLSAIREQHDPMGILESAASIYLYPKLALANVMEKKDGLLEQHQKSYAELRVGSFSEMVSHWRVSTDGDLKFINKTVCTVRNPSWLIYMGNSAGDSFALMVNEIKDYWDTEGIKMGAVSSYKLLSDGTMLHRSTVSSGGGSPLHASLSKCASSYCLYTASACGSISVHKVDYKTGIISNEPMQVLSLNEDVAAVAQCTSASYIHQIYVNNDNAYVVDRDLDTIHHYKIGVESGLLLINTRESIMVGSGTGPRHITVHPSGNYAFLISETASTITVLSVDGIGSISTGSSYSMLRESSSSEFMTGGEVLVSVDGKYVYGTVRDSSDPNQHRSSIVVFGFSELTGELLVLQHISSRGAHPRHFKIVNFEDADGIMIVANTDSDSLATFFVDAEQGTLRSTGVVRSTLPYHDQPVFIL